MNFHIYYDKPGRTWWAYWVDQAGNQVGDAVFDPSREWCLVYLGMNRPAQNS